MKPVSPLKQNAQRGRTSFPSSGSRVRIPSAALSENRWNAPERGPCFVLGTHLVPTGGQNA